MQDPVMQQLRRSGRVAQAFTVFALAVVALFAVFLVWLAITDPAGFDRLVAGSNSVGSQWTVTLPVRWAVMLFLFAGLGLTAWLILALNRAFGSFRTGHPFSAEASARFSAAGRASLWNAAWLLLSPTVFTLLMTINNPPGQKALSIAFGTSQFLAVMFAIVLHLVARMVSLAMRIDEENRSFV